jgi:hypothetical protein
VNLATALNRKATGKIGDETCAPTRGSSPRAKRFAAARSRKTVMPLSYMRNEMTAYMRHEANMRLSSSFHLDPLDREIMERAFHGTLAALQEQGRVVGSSAAESLENILRRELFKIAARDGVSDPDALRDLLLARVLDP